MDKHIGMASNIFTAVNIPECPTLFPSEEEFKHPIQYLSSEKVLAQGTYYGIVKVRPPPSWDPKFALDFDTFKFETRLQELPELSLKNRARADFLKGFNCYQKFNGRAPLYEGGDVYIGVSKPTIDFEKQNKYGWIHLKDYSRIHIHDVFISKDWQRWLDLAVERRLILNVIEYSQYVIAALNLPQEPTHANTEKGKDADKFTSLSPETDSHLMKYYKEPNDENLSLKSNQPLKSLLLSVESFIYNSIGEEEEKEEDDSDSEALSHDQHKFFVNDCSPTIELISSIQKKAKGKLVYKPSISNVQIKEMLKLDQSCVACHLDENTSVLLHCENCGDYYHTTCLIPNATSTFARGWYCSVCLVGGSGDYGFEMDDRKWSLNEFKAWNTENWGTGSKGKQWLSGLKRGIPNLHDISQVTELGLTEQEVEGLFWSLVSGRVELPKGLLIRYGADINNEDPTEVSGFPTTATVGRKTNSDGTVTEPILSEDQLKYANSEWNLTNLPFAKGSFFKYICGAADDASASSKEDVIIEEEDENEEIDIDSEGPSPAKLTPPSISGMSVPWLYVGGPFSTFCWHKEDHYTMSANYSHLGAPKQWYGVPSECCEEFERRVKEMIGPDIGRKQTDLMHQLVSQIPLEDIYFGDSLLRIYKATQRPGEFIVTFPRVYHSGFNYGLNVHEAVNFTNVEWMKYSPMAIREYKKVKKEPVFDILDTITTVLRDTEHDSEFCSENWISSAKLSEFRRVCQQIRETEVDTIIKIRNSPVKKESGLTVAEVLCNIRTQFLRDYLHDAGKDQLITKKILSIIGEKQNEDSVDLGICQRCKTRVHVEWVDIDVWRDWVIRLQQQLAVLEDGKAGETHGDNFDKIIKMAKEEHGESTQLPRIRIKRVKLETGKPRKRLSDQLAVKRTTLRWMSNKRLMDSGFGHVVLCLGCFAAEVAELDRPTLERMCLSSVHVTSEAPAAPTLAATSL